MVAESFAQVIDSTNPRRSNQALDGQMNDVKGASNDHASPVTRNCNLLSPTIRRIKAKRFDVHQNWGHIFLIISAFSPVLLAPIAAIIVGLMIAKMGWGAMDGRITWCNSGLGGVYLATAPGIPEAQAVPFLSLATAPNEVTGPVVPWLRKAHFNHFDHFIARSPT